MRRWSGGEVEGSGGEGVESYDLSCACNKESKLYFWGGGVEGGVEGVEGVEGWRGGGVEGWRGGGVGWRVEG